MPCALHCIEMHEYHIKEVDRIVGILLSMFKDNSE